jgi:hypothetical protein
MSVRGVKEINLSVRDQVIQPFLVEIIAEPWVRDTTLTSVLYFILLPALPMLISMVFLYTKNWCTCL